MGGEEKKGSTRSGQKRGIQHATSIWGNPDINWRNELQLRSVPFVREFSKKVPL